MLPAPMTEPNRIPTLESQAPRVKCDSLHLMMDQQIELDLQ